MAGKSEGVDGWIDGRGRNDIGPSIADQRDAEGEGEGEKEGGSQILVPTIKDTIEKGARRRCAAGGSSKSMICYF